MNCGAERRARVHKPRRVGSICGRGDEFEQAGRGDGRRCGQRVGAKFGGVVVEEASGDPLLEVLDHLR